MARQRRDAAIVGIHEYPLRIAPAVSAMQIKTDSILAALDDAGLSLRDVDAVVRQNRNPAFVDLGAYAVAYVDVDECFRMLTKIVGVDDPTQDMAIGQRVRVEIRAAGLGRLPDPGLPPDLARACTHRRMSEGGEPSLAPLPRWHSNLIRHGSGSTVQLP